MLKLRKNNEMKALNDREKKPGQNGPDSAYKREKAPFLTL